MVVDDEKQPFAEDPVHHHVEASKEKRISAKTGGLSIIEGCKVDGKADDIGAKTGDSRNVARPKATEIVPDGVRVLKPSGEVHTVGKREGGLMGPRGSRWRGNR
jgi:hypothetical protein